MGNIRSGAEPGDGDGADARLVAGLRRKSPTALAGLYEQHAAGIYSLALRLVQHVPDAEDITQDVLIRAYERMPQEREVMLRPWLYRLTMNRCYDHLRAVARRPAPFAATPDLPSRQDPFEQSELNRILEAALGDLTTRQRAAMLLKDVHGLTLVEVADCLDVTAGSVEVLLARARRAFRTSFEARCRAEGRSLPSSAGACAVLALPLHSLPSSFAPPPLVLPPLGIGGLPVAAAAGGGIGAAAGLPASFKTAALIVAAAATIGTAEVAVTHVDDAGSKRSPGSVALLDGPAVVSDGGASASSRPSASRSPRPTVSSSPSPSPAVAVAPTPSASPTEAADPVPAGAPFGISSPTPTSTESPAAPPSPRATSTAVPTAPPTPRPTAPPSPTASPSPTAPPTPSPSASPALSPSPAISSSPTPRRPPLRRHDRIRRVLRAWPIGEAAYPAGGRK